MLPQDPRRREQPSDHAPVLVELDWTPPSGMSVALVAQFWGVSRDEAFQRLHGKEYEGTGVGLAVTQQIVTAHGGTIEVRSEVGKGSLFRISLPVSG